MKFNRSQYATKGHGVIENGSLDIFLTLAKVSEHFETLTLVVYFSELPPYFHPANKDAPAKGSPQDTPLTFVCQSTGV